MTINEFLDLLRQTPRDWELRPGGLIRRPCGVLGWQCPYVAVQEAGYLSLEDAREVWAVADNKLGLHRGLRRRVLRACSLGGER